VEVWFLLNKSKRNEKLTLSSNQRQQKLYSILCQCFLLNIELWNRERKVHPLPQDKMNDEDLLQLSELGSHPAFNKHKINYSLLTSKSDISHLVRSVEFKCSTVTFIVIKTLKSRHN
jgi:hypothetical protein